MGNATPIVTIIYNIYKPLAQIAVCNNKAY